MSSFPKTACMLTTALMIFSQQAQALTLGQAAEVAQTAQTGAFNSIEMVAYNVDDRVPQWNNVKSHLKGDMVRLESCLNDESVCEGAAMSSWRSMVLGLKGQDQVAQVNMVNAFFNKWQYREDMDAYGVSEHWATPIEFMQNSGDCEDYAIAKYVTLIELGFNDNAMRITAGMDQNRGIGHSVLVVNVNEQKMVMDNLSDRVYASDENNGYQPRFAVNAESIYTYAQQPRVIMASYTMDAAQ